jgi:hypothetical protein
MSYKFILCVQGVFFTATNAGEYLLTICTTATQGSTLVYDVPLFFGRIVNTSLTRGDLFLDVGYIAIGTADVCIACRDMQYVRFTVFLSKGWLGERSVKKQEDKPVSSGNRIQAYQHTLYMYFIDRRIVYYMCFDLRTWKLWTLALALVTLVNFLSSTIDLIYKSIENLVKVKER